MFSCLKTFILMQFFCQLSVFFFSFWYDKFIIRWVGLSDTDISSLGISVHGSAYRPHHVRGSSTRYDPYPSPTHLITNIIVTLTLSLSYPYPYPNPFSTFDPDPYPTSNSNPVPNCDQKPNPDSVGLTNLFWIQTKRMVKLRWGLKNLQTTEKSPLSQG